MYFNHLKMGHKCSNYIKIHASLVKKKFDIFRFSWCSMSRKTQSWHFSEVIIIAVRP